PNQYSLKTVYLQVAETSPANLTRTFLRPQVVKQSLPDVDIASHRVGFVAVQLLLTALVLAAVARGGAMDALAAGPFLVLIWLTVNAYYWNMLALTGLVWAARQLAPGGKFSWELLAMHVTFGAYYLYQHLNAGFAEGYFVAVMLLGTMIVWAAQALLGARAPHSASPIG